MGVDYDANYGIGYQVEFGDVDDELLEEGLSEVLYGVDCDGTVESFSVGDGSYTGEEDDVFLVIKDPFSDGLDLTQKKAMLEVAIKERALEPVGEFGLVGGLSIW